MPWLYDSHIHLTDSEYETILPIILRGMEKMKLKACCVSVDYESSQKTLKLSQKTNLIFPFLGIHPENSKKTIDPLVNLIENSKNEISGIGEIGLDRTYTKNDLEFKHQKSIFEKQLQMAEKLRKPVSIHSRKTLDEILETLSSFSLNKVLLHWFDGNKKQLKKSLDMGYFVSFGPLLVYAKDKQILLSKTDCNNLLVETDGPVRFSRCFGFRPGQISLLPSVVFCAAKILNKKFDEMATLLEKNSTNYLNI